LTEEVDVEAFQGEELLAKWMAVLKETFA